jgi:hypothetical protein
MAAVEELSPTDLAIAREFNRFRGKLAGHIESYSLPERQERGIISMMKNLSYEAEAKVKAVVSPPPGG